MKEGYCWGILVKKDNWLRSLLKKNAKKNLLKKEDSERSLEKRFIEKLPKIFEKEIYLE